MRHAQRFLRRLLPIAGALAVVSVAWATVTHRTPVNHRPLPNAATPVAPALSVAALRPAVTRPVLVPGPAPAKNPTLRAEAAPARAGLRAFLDPETGTIGGPPPASSAAPADRAPLPDAPAPIARLATDGSPMLDLQGGLQEYAVLRITPDGRRVMRCVPDPKAPLETERSSAATPVEE